MFLLNNASFNALLTTPVYPLKKVEKIIKNLLTIRYIFGRICKPSKEGKWHNRQKLWVKSFLKKSKKKA